MIDAVKQMQRKLFDQWVDSCMFIDRRMFPDETLEWMWEAWQAAQEDENDLNTFVMKEYRSNLK